MSSAGDPHVTAASQAQASGPASTRGIPVRVARAANDNHRTHAPWRRFVAATMAALFAASLILVGLACIATEGEPQTPFTASN